MSLIRLTNLRFPVELPEAEIPEQVARKLGIPDQEFGSWRILRKSLDARQKENLEFVYSVVIDVPQGNWRDRGTELDLTPYAREPFDDPPAGSQRLESRPIIIGSGPAGLLAGYYLAKRGYCPLILERGAPVKERVPAIREFDRGGEHDPDNNYLFGEGGAGTFSDGKLTCRMSGPDVDWVLESMVECGGTPSIRYIHRPHLGSNRLPMLVRNYRRKIESMGGEYRFHCRFEGLRIVDGKVVGIETSSGSIPSSLVILAIGHSARDTYEILHEQGVPMRAKAFQLGLRIEQPQEQVNRWKYGRERYLEILGAADYTLVARGERDLFTFCMCAGGWIIPSVSEPNRFCTNGMSNSRHETRFANSGLVVTINPEELGSQHPLAGVHLQRHYEGIAFEKGDRNYLVPIQLARDFVRGTASNPATKFDCSYQRGYKPIALDEVLPPGIIETIRKGLPIMNQQWKGEFLRDAVLVGPEMRGSSPIRIERDLVTRQTPNLVGLYPVGEGAGYAGGIVSAAVDGLRTAREIVRAYSPLES